MQNNYFSLPHTYRILSLLLMLFFHMGANAQVSLRDTVVNWQHHEFELNEDYSMKSWSTNSSDIMQVSYPNSKVLENELIRLVIVPEYGARVLSFVYKPTGHEYLYQSECGSAYGMGEGNFYYNWLMVWGGIFPTFPESEHGKTWLLPWDYSLVKNTPDTITIRMEYTDSKSFSNAPGRFNNGITGITCRVDVSVYSGSSLWDFRVTLINNKSENVIYEYWTCTTLTPGSEPGNTSSPLNSEMIVPIDLYSAGWSPGGWIGNYGSLYNFSTINFLSNWNDMGIAYAHNLNDDYWGVINQDNQNGIFRVADNQETFGMKFWTWGKDAINSNMFDFHNGGKDSYIELWPGVSDYFFTDAVLAPNQVKSWNESYSATVGLKAISAINRNGAVDLQWDVEKQTLSYHLNVFSPFNQYDLNLSLAGNTNIPLAEESFTPDLLGNSGSYKLDDPGLAVPKGLYTAIFELSSQDGLVILRATKEISAGGETSAFNPVSQPENAMRITQTVPLAVNISFLQTDSYNVNVYNTIGQLVTQKRITGNSLDIQLPTSGVYIFNVSGSTEVFNRKVLVR